MILPTFRLGNMDILDAREYLGSDTYTSRPLGTIENCSIHHWTGPTPSANLAIGSEITLMKRIADLHRAPPRNWLGYAYHLTVFPSGRIYLTGAIDTIRYVVGGAGNIATVAIALPGDFTDEPPSDLHLAAVADTIAELRFALGNGALPIKGHYEVASKPTACPGATFSKYNDGPGWRVALEYHPAPEPEPDPRSPEQVHLDVIYARGLYHNDQDILAAVNAIKEIHGYS